MRKAELAEQLHALLQDVVQRSGGEWKRSYGRDVEQIFVLFGKLSPEPNSGNLRTVVPDYNKHLVKKVGKPTIKVAPEHAAKAREILRRMGML